jgi:hypothetical protein
MHLIEKIQKLPHEQKIKIIWAIAGLVVILLIIVWVISAHYKKEMRSDGTLLNTIDSGIKDVKRCKDNPDDKYCQEKLK